MKVDELRAEMSKSIKRTTICRSCVHKNVCKFMDSNNSCCKDFINSEKHEVYGNIYSMFEPVFKWMKKHYPSGGVHFVVEQNKAQMYLEHGVSVYSRELKGMFCVENRQKENEEVGQ